LLVSQFDPLLLRLTQHSYLRAGLTQNVLNCISRYPYLLNFGKTYKGTALGLLAEGYVENGRYQEAEEISKQAMAMSAFRDILPTLSLAHSFQFQGKTSDITELYEKHYHLFHSGETRYHLRCMRGHALIMRGNCHGAYNSILDILDSYSGEEIAKAKDSYNPHHLLMPFPLFLDVIMLLWHINIHLTPKHILNIDISIDTLLPLLEKYTLVSNELKFFCYSILLATKVNAYETKNTSSQIVTYEKEKRVQDIKKKEESSFFTFPKIFGFNRKVRQTIDNNNSEAPPTPAEEDHHHQPPHQRFDVPPTTEDNPQMQSPSLLINENDTNFNHDSENYDEKSLAVINEIKSQLSATSFHSEYQIWKKKEKESFRNLFQQNKFSHFNEAKPNLVHLSYSNEDPKFLSQLDEDMSKRESSYENVMNGILSFGLRDYSQANGHFSKDVYNYFQRLGLSRNHRDILQQTFIERFWFSTSFFIFLVPLNVVCFCFYYSLIRDNQFQNARALLLER
jgi:hypothetical protein